MDNSFNYKDNFKEAPLRVMDTDVFLAVLQECLRAITTPRMFKTERGYQGKLITELSIRLPQLKISDPQVVIEQEYQKRLRIHGLTKRPDIIVHVPFNPRQHAARSEDNFAVIELKRRASSTKARADFEKLSAMMKALCYRLGIFVNIDSVETHFTQASHKHSGRIVSFAVKLENGNVSLTRKGA